MCRIELWVFPMIVTLNQNGMNSMKLNLFNIADLTLRSACTFKQIVGVRKSIVCGMINI